ncbi:M15 family metallopeptidase [Dongshaea marina]|uniref:M15 family metallopeptidase n=1 Tax=Dongshaea marina TaxID=2047966 RepID=UPI000D3E2D2C|nr:M15 family metallopeptidase [Dongshaea marina]
MTPEQLTGRDSHHLHEFAADQALQPEVYRAWCALQQAAANDGFDLQAASSYRSFERQKQIWDGKFDGKRPLLDSHSRPVDLKSLSEWQKIEHILRWSALPGASRHHWGTELDLYDPSLLLPGESLKLIPDEYDQGGCQAPLCRWLDDRMSEFGFFKPYARDLGGVSREPWHLSYQPLAELCLEQLTPQLLQQTLSLHPVRGYAEIQPRLDYIFERYILNINQG